jgi:hypothetical protein
MLRRFCLAAEDAHAFAEWVKTLVFVINLSMGVESTNEDATASTSQASASVVASHGASAAVSHSSPLTAASQHHTSVASPGAPGPGSLREADKSVSPTSSISTTSPPPGITQLSAHPTLSARTKSSRMFSALTAGDTSPTAPHMAERVRMAIEDDSSRWTVAANATFAAELKRSLLFISITSPSSSSQATAAAPSTSTGRDLLSNTNVAPEYNTEMVQLLKSLVEKLDSTDRRMEAMTSQFEQERNEIIARLEYYKALVDSERNLARTNSEAHVRPSGPSSPRANGFNTVQRGQGLKDVEHFVSTAATEPVPETARSTSTVKSSNNNMSEDAASEDAASQLIHRVPSFPPDLIVTANSIVNKQLVNPDFGQLVQENSDLFSALFDCYCTPRDYLGGAGAIEQRQFAALCTDLSAFNNQDFTFAVDAKIAVAIFSKFAKRSDPSRAAELEFPQFVASLLFLAVTNELLLLDASGQSVIMFRKAIETPGQACLLRNMSEVHLSPFLESLQR